MASKDCVAFSSYAHACGCTQICGVINPHVVAYVNGKEVYDDTAECYFGDDAYGNNVLSILWHLSDEQMHMLGLFGTVNTGFQSITFDGTEMVVTDRKHPYELHFDVVS